jgi:hypothetical protein
MAITSNPADFTAPVIKVGPKTAIIAFYVLIGTAAIAIGVPAAIMTADAGMFEECYTACAGVAQ